MKAASKVPVSLARNVDDFFSIVGPKWAEHTHLAHFRDRRQLRVVKIAQERIFQTVAVLFQRFDAIHVGGIDTGAQVSDAARPAEIRALVDDGSHGLARILARA